MRVSSILRHFLVVLLRVPGPVPEGAATAVSGVGVVAAGEQLQPAEWSCWSIARLRVRRDRGDSVGDRRPVQRRDASSHRIYCRQHSIAVIIIIDVTIISINIIIDITARTHH